MKERKRRIERQRAWRARRKKVIAEEGNVSKDLSEARIANCYYPEDNKTVTIFADSKRGKHERARRKTERTTRTKKRERMQTGKDDERIGYEEHERPIGGEEDRQTPPFTLEQEKKRIKRERGRLGTKKRTCQVAGTLRPLPPPSAFFADPSLTLPRTLVPPLAHSCSTTPSVTTTPIGRLLQPRSPRSARFSTASRRILYKGFIIRSFLLHLYRARLGEIFSISLFDSLCKFSSFSIISNVPRILFHKRIMRLQLLSSASLCENHRFVSIFKEKLCDQEAFVEIKADVSKTRKRIKRVHLSVLHFYRKRDFGCRSRRRNYPWQVFSRSQAKFNFKPI